MARLNKLAVKFGWMPVNVLFLGVTLFLVCLVLLWQQTSQTQQQTLQARQYQQQIFDGLTQHLSSALADWQKQLATIASQSVDEVSQMSEYELGLWQQEQLRNMSDLDRLCVINAIPSAPQDSGCLPISFASLEQLRQLKKTGKSQSIYIQAGDASHLLMLTQLVENGDAILMAALSPEALKSKVLNTLVQDAYVEIAQGEGNVLPIFKFGNSAIKQGSPNYQKRLNGSFLQVKYWFTPETTSGDLFSVVLVAALILIGWLLQQFWLKLVLRHDAECICEQIADYEELALKPSYFIALPAFHSVSDAIHRLAALSGKKKASTAQKEVLQPVMLGDVVESFDEAPATDEVSETEELVQNFSFPEPASGIEVEELEQDETVTEESPSATDSEPDSLQFAEISEQEEAVLDVFEVDEEEPVSGFEENEALSEEPEDKDDTPLQFVTSFDADTAEDEQDNFVQQETETNEDDTTLTFVSSEIDNEEASEPNSSEPKTSPSEVPDALLKLWDEKH